MSRDGIPLRSATRQKGAAALFMVAILAVAAAGLSVAMLEEGRGSRTDVDRTEAQIRALELAEVGLARAHVEIASRLDAAGDGVGNMTGSFAGGTYAVTATQNGNEWTLVSVGRVAKALRRIEQGVRRTVPSAPGAAIIATGDISFSGSGAQTDSYDSTLGTYASQATNSDAAGSYANANGSVMSNSDISVGSSRIRGDAQAGPGHETDVGSGVVTGSTAPMAEPLALPDPPLADFAAALLVNDNGSWTVTGGKVNYDAVKKTFSVSGGAVVTFPPGTYFFSKFSVSGGAEVVFTGPTKIYDTARFDTTGGSITNATGLPKNLVVYAHPYDFPGVTSATSSLPVSIAGGAGTALSFYGPQTSVSITGGSDVYGAIVGGTVSVTGGTFFHYDTSLEGTGTGGDSGLMGAIVTQTYWRESRPPVN
jgi:hypothetical protein